MNITINSTILWLTHLLEHVWGRLEIGLDCYITLRVDRTTWSSVAGFMLVELMYDKKLVMLVEKLITSWVVAMP